ncbi:MAG: bifunctional YncE family protein/alkaline phosphatase family protein [Candidatus Acidiferrales bacterium]
MISRTLVRFSIFAILGFLAAALIALPLRSQQSSQTGHEPASEGRNITPAGSLVLDSTTGQLAVGSLPVAFVRSPDHTAKDGGGRYLVAINSGYGIQFSAATNEAQQSIAVLDLNAHPAPKVIQNVYFPSPQSASVGAAFSPNPAQDGSYTLYVSGGYENKVWMFRFQPGVSRPVSPPSYGPNTKVTAPYLSVRGFATEAASPRLQGDQEPVYPLGLAVGADGDSLFVANDLGDSLGIIRNLRGERHLARVDLSDGHPGHFVYPYGVVAFTPQGSRETQKVYVSCWATASVAVVDAVHPNHPVKFVPAGRHPTAMVLNPAGTRLYVANSDADSVTVIDTAQDRAIETISVRLAEKALPGGSPEGLALSPDGGTLYVANAHSNAVAVVGLSPASQGRAARSTTDDGDNDNDRGNGREQRSTVRGLIPTGQYPSALAFANGSLFVGNGKGTGFDASSMHATMSGRAPNIGNDRFPVGTGRNAQGGEYDVALIAGTISRVAEPDAPTLAAYTAQVLRNDGLIGAKDVRLFSGASPIHHIIYVIRENRTYDQVFGDVEKAGNGQPADGDADLAIFGNGDAAERPGGPPQHVTPNAHALAQRFGLLDRFFVNSEASPDGHNWTDAAFSSDYVDKAYRWNYSDRGRTYDFQGTNREPEIWPRKGEPPLLPIPATADEIAHYMQRFVPYLNGVRDIGEPNTLYLWDDAARAGISYRSNGEFVASISQAELDSFNANRPREYPDTSPTVIEFPLKKALEGHTSPTHREFDLYTPDSMTTASYRAAKESNGHSDPLISAANADPHFRGYSRIAAWLQEFRGYVSARADGQADSFPAFNIVYLPNDHTSGMRPHMPTPQFYVADNDYALGLLVQEVSSSPYWKDTAIFVLEDDAQNGPDHVDGHRSPALVISAYNRPGALIHDYHSTVSLIRTMELLLGMPPMNQLDASAAPMDIFQSQPDLAPYKAILPDVATNNLVVQSRNDSDAARWIHRSLEQNFEQADLADPAALNRIIWFSVRGAQGAYPASVQLPVFDAMRTGLAAEAAEDEDAQILLKIKTLLASHRQAPSGPASRRN